MTVGLRILLFLLITCAIHAETLQEAEHSLADRIAAHLSAGETPHVIARNLSSLPDTEFVKIQAAVEKALPRRIRNGSKIEVTLTLSENVKGYLLIAEIQKSENRAVEIARFTVPPPPVSPAPVSITKRLLWRQEHPILDLAVIGNEMLVLEPEALVRYERRDANWVQVESAHLNTPPLRDPRGRMEIDDSRVNIFFPGATCRGTWNPTNLECDPTSGDFTLGGAQMHFTPKGNTMEGGSKANLEGVGDAIAICGEKLLASGGGRMDSEDTITIFDGATPVSEPIELPGPVTALWPASEGALAVVLNPSIGDYAAYALSVDCGR